MTSAVAASSAVGTRRLPLRARAGWPPPWFVRMAPPGPELPHNNTKHSYSNPNTRTIRQPAQGSWRPILDGGGRPLPVLLLSGRPVRLLSGRQAVGCLILLNSTQLSGWAGIEVRGGQIRTSAYGGE